MKLGLLDLDNNNNYFHSKILNYFNYSKFYFIILFGRVWRGGGVHIGRSGSVANESALHK